MIDGVPLPVLRALGRVRRFAVSPVIAARFHLPWGDLYGCRDPRGRRYSLSPDLARSPGSLPRQPHYLYSGEAFTLLIYLVSVHGLNLAEPLVRAYRPEAVANPGPTSNHASAGLAQPAHEGDHAARVSCFRPANAASIGRCGARGRGHLLAPFVRRPAAQAPTGAVRRTGGRSRHLWSVRATGKSRGPGLLWLARAEPRTLTSNMKVP